MSKKGNWRGKKRGGFGGGGGFGKRNNHEKSGRGNYMKYQNQTEQLSEPEVGITEYLSPLEGFSGVIKARYSDFHVNEINLDGEVAKFTDTKIPKEFIEGKASEVPKESPIADIEQSKWDEILNMMSSSEEIKINLDVSDYDKQKRSVLHKTIKNIFRKKIVSSTVVNDNDQKKFIELKKYKVNQGREDNRTEWPEGLPKYVHFILYKESMDTMQSIMKLSSLLYMPASAYNYAGVKDRRAKTTQWVSVYKVQPYKLLIKTKFLNNLHISNITFKDQPLKLGHLKGNQFKIALRNVTADDNVISDAMKELEKTGFINYYGLQRFGTDKEVPTYEIGLKLMQGKWKQACELILKPKKCEDQTSDITQAKIIYQETGSAAKANEKLKNYDSSTIEAKLLNGLACVKPNEFIPALERIPRNTRLLYIHSFQSLIWNRVVSKRIKLGLKPIIGDLVLIDSNETQMDTSETISTPLNNSDVEDDKGAESKEDEDLINNLDEEIVDLPKANQKVKLLTENDLDNYTIFDIVLPLPGYDVTYPENSFIKDYYKEILESHGLSLEMTKQKVKIYSLSGGYRKIIERVENLSWKIMKYMNPNDTLIRSDFEEYKNQPEPESVEDGKYKGLVINFNLSSSCYATMVLRELLKLDTSNRSQAKLNNYHKPIAIPEEPPVAENSLLSDKDKFEAFKKAIFENTDPVEQNRIPEDEIEPEVKKRKLDEPDKDSGIKIQASLV